MAVSRDTTIDFTTPGDNYKGRIHYDNLSTHFVLQNSATSPTLTIDDTSLTVNKNMNFINSDMFYFQSSDGTTNTAMTDKSSGIVFLHILLITKLCQH